MLTALPNAFADAPTNMAIDSALLENIPTGLAAFRHYGWLEPAASFGYAQTFEAVQKNTDNDLCLVRRLTGGGIVDHRNDWTYALIIHSSLHCATRPATALYKQIHDAISFSLKKMELENHLAPCPKACHSPLSSLSDSERSHAQHPTKPSSEEVSQCFVTPAANDVILPNGKKIAGAAMKRTRHGLLVQGSLDRSALPDNFNFIKLQNLLLQQLSAAFELPIGELEDLRPLFKSERIEHEKQRFASQAWNKRR